MIVDVFPELLAKRPERLAPVVRNMQQRVHHIDAIKDPGVGEILPDNIVGWRRYSSNILAQLSPPVSERKTRPRPCRPRRSHRARRGQAATRQGRSFPYRRAAAPCWSSSSSDRRRSNGTCRNLGLAVDQRPDMPPTLVGRRIKNVRIAGVEDDIGDACIAADRQDGLPGLAAVGRLVQSTISSRFHSGPCAAT